MNFLTTITTFILLANWFQLFFFAKNLLSPTKKEVSKNKEILKIANKTGINLEKFIIIHSDRIFGGVSGITKPFMMLSKGVLTKLNKNELEYIILHESAHFKYHHPLLMTITQASMLTLTILITYFFSYIAALLTSIALGFIYIHIFNKLFEEAAENFAAKNIKDPKNMISAINKFEKNWMGNSNVYPVTKKIFSPNLTYEAKRNIAKKYMLK